MNICSSPADLVARHDRSVEILARKMENEHHTFSSPRLVRDVAEFRLFTEALWRLISTGPDGRVKRDGGRGTAPSAVKKREELFAAAVAKAKELLRRRRAMTVRFFADRGFPWPEDMR